MPSEAHERMVREIFPRFAPGPTDTFETMRRRWDAEAAKLAPDDPAIETRRVMIGPMAAAWVRKIGAHPARTLLYVHGGGYVQGSIAGYRGMAGRLATAVDGRVLLFEYRLAPENPFPAGLDDTITAYAWLLESGTPAGDIVLAGDSAGGGLALAALLRLKELGVAMPGACVCFSPLGDFEASGYSATPGVVDDPMIDAAAIPLAGGVYAPGQLRNPLVSPIHGDFSGLPPLLIFAGTREVLLDDAVRMHKNAIAAGVDATLVVREGLTHAWPYFGPTLPESQETVQQVRRFVDEKTNRRG